MMQRFYFQNITVSFLFLPINSLDCAEFLKNIPWLVESVALSSGSQRWLCWGFQREPEMQETIIVSSIYGSATSLTLY